MTELTKIIAVTAGKGGSGKTITAALLADAYGRAGRKTILVELDSGFRCCDKLLGVDDAIAFDLSDAIAGRCALLATVYPTVRPNLDLIAAAQSADVFFSPDILRGFCDELSLYYDVVVLDVPNHYYAVGALAGCADTALLVTTPDPVSARACYWLSVRLEQLGIADLRLVINRIPRTDAARRKLPMPDLDEVMDAAALRLAAVLPESGPLYRFGTLGEFPSPRSLETRIFTALAKRLQGENIPLLVR